MRTRTLREGGPGTAGEVLPPREAPLFRHAEPFLPLEENRLAQVAVTDLHRRANRNACRLVYLFGEAGVGKSHLVRHFVRAERRVRPTEPLIHVTAAQFAADLADASTDKSIPEFQDRYRQVDLLVCEDLGALSGRMESQRQLVCVLDEILRSGGRILLTARRLPGELDNMDRRLVNRCQAASSADIRIPSRDSRVQLIEHFAGTRQIPLTRDVAALLADGLPVSPREFLAAVVQLESYARQQGTVPDAEFTRRFLAGDIKRPPVTLSRIARTVARQFGTSVGELRTNTRRQACLLPRQFSMLLARELTEEPLRRIAAYFGRQNHSTVVHAGKRLKKILDEDPAVRRQFAQIRQALRVPDELPE